MKDHKQSRKTSRAAWIFLTVIIVGLVFGTVGYAQDKNEKQRVEAQTQATSVAKLKTDQYNTCIKTANDLYNKYLAKTPTESSATDRLNYTQTITQIWNSNKADCDRTYSQ